MKIYTLTEEGRLKWLEIRLGGSGKSGLTLNEETLLLDAEVWGTFAFGPGMYAHWIEQGFLSLERKGLIEDTDEDT